MLSAPQVRNTLPDIILLSIDSLRPDRLGCYGSGLGLTPNIDALARGSTVFSDAFTVAPMTISSLTQVLSGRFEHRIARLALESAGTFMVSPLTPTVASLLRDRGYRTHAFLGGMHLGSFPFVATGFHSVGALESHRHNLSTKAMLQDMLALIEDRKRGPVFLWSHIMDVHNGNRDRQTSSQGTTAYDTERLGLWTAKLESSLMNFPERTGDARP